MDLTGITALILLIVTMSLSGVLMPGPVTAVTLARGAKSPHAGAWVSIGHGAIEFPLMALIFFGAGALFQIVPVKVGIGIAGGAVLLWMGIGMLRDYKKVEVSEEEDKYKTRSPFVAGAVLSLANPYFLIWWATAGALLIEKSFTMGLMGFIVLAVVHWLCDFGWYYFLSALSHKGGKFFGRKLQEAVFIFCGLILFFFTGFFGGRAAFTLLNLIGA